MGWLYSKTSATKPKARLKELREAHENFISYLKQTRSYEFHTHDLEKYKTSHIVNTQPSTEEFSSTLAAKQAAFDNNMVNQATERSEKIRRYKELKEVESQMDKMFLVLNSAHTDEDQRRSFYMTLIEYWINKSIDELKLIDGKIYFG
jgi:hypothetical protein